MSPSSLWVARNIGALGLPGSVGAATRLWDIAVPSRPGRLAEVTMAGFSYRTKDPLDLRVVPCPTVTLFIALSDGGMLTDASGRQCRGSVVAGLASGDVRGQGRDIECLQWSRFGSQIGLTPK